MNKLINKELIINKILKDETFHPSHFAKLDESFLGFGILYYGFTYMLKAQVAVTLGSGSGFVPRLQRQAQLDLGLKEKSITILIDANLPDAGFGKPDYHDKETYFTKEFDIKIFKETTKQARKRFSEKSINYLHIDADHSYTGAMNDLMIYKEFMKDFGIITMHDTAVTDNENVGVWKVIKFAKKMPDLDVLNIPFGMGMAILRKKR